MIIVSYSLTPAAERARFLTSGRWFSGTLLVDPVNLGPEARERVGRCWTIVDASGQRTLATANVQGDASRRRGYMSPFAYTLPGQHDSEEAALQAFAAAVNLSITNNGG